MKKLLQTGDLHQCEKLAEDLSIQFSNALLESVLQESAQELMEPLKTEGMSKGASKFKRCMTSVRLSSGHNIQVPNWYANQVPENWAGTRNLISNHWGLLGTATPLLADKVGFCATISPSYDLANELLMKNGVKIGLSSVRAISTKLAARCKEFGEVKLLMGKHENLRGKRIVIGVDGGRTRTRTYKEEVNINGNLKYDGNWKEPKLFVIDVLNQDGKPDPTCQPFYGIRFAEEDMLELLKKYGKELEIEKAAQVQIIGDGAAWIWLRIKALLVEIGVDENKIIETLDYFHSSEYVHDLVKALPKRLNQTQLDKKLGSYKEWLWKGESILIVKDFRSLSKRNNQETERILNYLEKHNLKTQYADYQSNKLMCGSGIVESAIRRVINLRYKSNATFWNQDTVETLFFFRGAVVSKRWDNIFSNFKTA